MGGGYYERNENESNLNNNGDNSDSYNTISVGQQTELFDSFNPKNWNKKKMISTYKNPIVFALDVTGSMGEWSKIIYEKMPMFYGQIMIQKYLQEPGISFAAIGDIKTEAIALQVTCFGHGSEIDNNLSHLVICVSGGGNDKESYDLAAYFYAYQTELKNAELPFLFFTGDEGFWEESSNEEINRLFDIDFKEEKIDSRIVFQDICQKYNLFILRKKYGGGRENIIQKQWEEVLGKERVLKVETPKAVIDIVLGAIALTSRSRTLDEYLKDMEDRGQDSSRINEVKNSLIEYARGIIKEKVTIVETFKELIIDEEENEELNELDNLTEITKKLQLSDDKLTSNQSKYLNDLIKLKDILENKIPEELICPLTKNIYFNPVKLSDGSIFEECAIQYWLKNHTTNPISKKKIDKIVTLSQLKIQEVNEFYEQSKYILDI